MTKTYCRCQLILRDMVVSSPTISTLLGKGRHFECPKHGRLWAKIVLTEDPLARNSG